MVSSCEKWVNFDVYFGKISEFSNFDEFFWLGFTPDFDIKKIFFETINKIAYFERCEL